MHDPRHRPRLDAGVGQHLPHAVGHAHARVLGRREHLADAHRAVTAREHDVRERPTHIDADIQAHGAREPRPRSRLPGSPWRWARSGRNSCSTLAEARGRVPVDAAAGDDHAVVAGRALDRDLSGAHVGEHELGIPALGRPETTAAGRAQHEPLAGGDGDVGRLRRDRLVGAVVALDAPRARGAGRAAGPPGRRDVHPGAAHGHLGVGEQLDDRLDAEAAAGRARAAGVGPQPGRAHDERVLRLERFELGDDGAAAEEERAGRVGPVVAGARAETTELVEQVQPPLPAGVEAGERVHVDQRARADGVLGPGGRQRLEDRLDRRRDGHDAPAARRGRRRVHERPRRQRRREGPEAAFVHRDRRVDEAPHRVHDAGQRLRERRVDHPARLR